MPEEYQDPQDPQVSEASEEPLEGETQQSEPEGDDAGAKGPKHIPYDRFQEVWNERQDARQYAQNLQMQILQMQQQVQQAQHYANQPKMPDIDPEIEQIVAPVLAKHMGPLVQKLQMAENELLRVQAKAEAENAWGYVLQHVPDMEDLKEDIAREIEKKSPTIQKKITSDPDMVIELAEKVRLLRASGQITASKKTQADLRGRSRSESGGTGTNPSRNSRNIDWSSLSDEEYDREQARVMRQKRGY